MKRLFYIANIRMPTERAHGIQVVKMCEAFANAGVSVELVVPSRLNSLQRDPFEYYGVKKNFEITRLPVLDTVSFGRVGFWFESFLFFSAARLYLGGKEGRVYTREEAVGLFFRDIFLELHTIPRSAGLLRKRIWRKARVLFVITHLLKNELAREGIDPQKIKVVPDAVDLAQFDIPVSKEEARKRLGLPIDKRIILYTGSFFLYDWKGVDVLLEAAEQIKDLKFKISALFVLVGGSDKEIAAAEA
ncbi:MAG: group 1 glycosyl transferase, partial [Parcubacteria group bacterium Greene0416_79]